jgi:hypothetical protein
MIELLNQCFKYQYSQFCIGVAKRTPSFFGIFLLFFLFLKQQQFTTAQITADEQLSSA